MDDAAIHRVSRGTGGVVCSVTEDQWIATGLRPRDDKQRSITGFFGNQHGSR
jgi:hypothetical protein